MILRLVILLISAVLFSVTCVAEKMSYENHSLVIKKLETALSLMGKKDSSLLPTTKRLADLYSERARIAEFDEIEKNCKSCMNSKQDRLQAIKLYNKVISLGLENGTIITQLAHLYTLTGQEHKSTDLYKRIIRKGTPTYSRLLVGESHLAIAYMDYKKDNYKKALKNFELAKKNQTKQPVSVTNYYISWCKFNLGQEKTARALMEASLRSAIVEAKTNPDMVDFANQASRDLTIFYARTNLTPQRINNLLDLTPQSMQISNFKALAEEVERLGKHKSTARIWGLITKVTKDPTAKIEALFRYAKSSYNIGHLTTAQNQFSQAIQLWKNNSCVTSDDFDCKELKIHFRNFIINWNNTEKSKPSKQLLSAYTSYLSLFSRDKEMLQWAAQAATYRKDHKTARNFYRRISENKLEEGSLLAEIESAEKTNQNNLKLESYDYYLSKRPGGKNASNIRYQKAQTLYEMKKYSEANAIFCRLAETRHKNVGLKSAHLCVDTFAILKMPSAVEKHSLKYSSLYRKNRTEFMKIARNAGLNIVAGTVNKNSSRSELRRSLRKLENINLVGASQIERVKVYKNIIVVADQLDDIAKALQATNVLYKEKGLSKADNEYCLKKQVYYHETLLNFKTALNKFKKLHPMKKASKSQLIRMSVLAELAGLSTKKYDEKILKKTKGTYASNKVRAKIVLNSKYPWSTFKKFEKKLKKSKKLYSNLTLELYSLSPSSKNRSRVLKNSFLKWKAAGQRLHRTENIKNINAIKAKINNHKINNRNDRLLAKTLKRRLALINDLEKSYKNAASDKDWVGQTIALELISNQYTRLYNTILKLKAPRGLKANQIAEFKRLLQQQANPYLKKATVARNKANVFWRNEKLFKNLVTDHNSAKISVQKLIAKEITELSRYTSNNYRGVLSQARSTSKPNKQQIVQVYNQIRKQPFNPAVLSAGVSLEKKMERETRATYFAERLRLSNKRKVN